MVQQLPTQLKILEYLQTRSDLVALEEKLNILSDTFGKVTTNHEQVIKETLDFITFNKLNEDFQMLNLNLNSQEDFENYLELIQRKLTQLKVLKITTAIVPTKETVDEIFYWAQNALSKSILLDLNTDPTLIGGIIVEYQGKYKDYSFKKKLENFFSTNPNLT